MKNEWYEGTLIDGLKELVVTVTDTHQTPSTSALEADNCEHCHASYGHTILCPLLNRNIAEAQSALNGSASEQDKVHAHALGIIL